jgi:hypothetical protein
MLLFVPVITYKLETKQKFVIENEAKNVGNRKEAKTFCIFASKRKI